MAGSRSATKIPMIAITTSSSTSVKPTRPPLTRRQCLMVTAAKEEKPPARFWPGLIARSITNAAKNARTVLLRLRYYSFCAIDYRRHILTGFCVRLPDGSDQGGDNRKQAQY